MRPTVPVGNPKTWWMTIAVYHKNGTIRQVGFTAHCQKAAIEMIRRYDLNHLAE